MAAALLERAARWLSVRLKINVERPRRRAANDVRAVWRRPAGASMRIICTIYSLDRTSLSDRHVSTWEGDNASPGGGLALTGRAFFVVYYYFFWSMHSTPPQRKHTQHTQRSPYFPPAGGRTVEFMPPNLRSCADSAAAARKGQSTHRTPSC